MREVAIFMLFVGGPLLGMCVYVRLFLRERRANRAHYAQLAAIHGGRPQTISRRPETASPIALRQGPCGKGGGPN